MVNGQWSMVNGQWSIKIAKIICFSLLLQHLFKAA
jgi:hypothetical protein